MAATTGIAWADHTFNPWWGCTKISPGCTHCYAARQSGRYGFDVWGSGVARRLFGEQHWVEPVLWDRAARRRGVRRRVLCASMADVADRDAPRAERERLWKLIATTQSLDWLVLTKRPEALSRVLPATLIGAANLWLGTSIERQEFEWRRQALTFVPAVVHFVSAEPLLGPLRVNLSDVEWLIVGGESAGPPQRALVERRVEHGWEPKAEALEWVRALRDAAEDAAAPFFFKQWGGPRATSAGDMLDGRAHHAFPQPVSPW